MTLVSNPAFTAYALTCVLLAGLLIALWAYSGVVRGRTKTALNAEDAAKFSAALVAVDPPEVARVLRAHANAAASTYPFLFLGLVFVLLGGSPTVATIAFVVFTAARVLHAFAYLRGLQPWRTIAFVAGLLATAVLLFGSGWLAWRGG